MLVKTLLEAKQTVPDFLKSYIPEGYTPGANVKLDFEDESEGEEGNLDNADMNTSKAEYGTEVTANGGNADDWGMPKGTTTTNGQTDDWGVTTPAQPATAPERRASSEDVWVTATTNVWDDKKPAPADDTWGVGATTTNKPAAAQSNWGASAVKSAAPKTAAAKDDWGANSTNKPATGEDNWGKPANTTKDDPWDAPPKKSRTSRPIEW